MNDVPKKSKKGDKAMEGMGNSDMDNITFGGGGN